MKHFLLIASLGLAPLAAEAQQLPAAAWQFSEMKGNGVVVVFKKDSARVQKDTSVLLFAIIRAGNEIRLKNKSMDQEALQLLGISADSVNQKAGSSQSNLLPLEKMLTAANQLEDKKLLLQGRGETQLADASDSQAADSIPLEERGEAGPAKALSPSFPWLYVALPALLAFVLGWLAKPKGKKVEPVAAAPSVPAATPAPGVPDAALQQKVTRLEQQLMQKQQEIAQLEREDQQYYRAVFDQLLIPMQESLEQDKKNHLLAQMVTASALLNSLTRHKLGKKGKYDDANLNLLTGHAAGVPDAPVITGATPPDQIPHHLRGLIALLKENGITGLGDLVLNGYRVKDL